VVSDHEGSLLVGSLAKTDVILALAGSARPGANRTLPPSLTPNEA
jgi:hypothetical protein